MSDPTRELLDQIYRLPREDRALIAIEAAASLEEDTEGVEKAWAAEIAKRLQEIKAGTVETIPWKDALGEIRASLTEARRGPRSDHAGVGRTEVPGGSHDHC